MSSTSETGHAKNVAFFEQLIIYIIGLAAAYNPSKAYIKLPAMQALLESAKETINKINSTYPAYSNAAAAREAAFAPLSKLITRVNNALKASDTAVQVDENAKAIIRKIQGTRASSKTPPEERAAAKAEGKEIKENSTSQMSFDSRLDNFDKLIKLLASIPQYAPNEADLKVTALTALYADLKDKNLAATKTETPLTNARIARNEILYKSDTGVIDTASDAKTYIKSVFGPTSPQFKAISGLQFKDYSNKKSKS